MGFFDRLKAGLKKTKDNFIGKIDTILAGFGKIDDELFEELEYILITADFGIGTTNRILDVLKSRVKEEKLTDPQKIRNMLQEIISQMLDIEGKGSYGLDTNDVPCVITVIGVNGVGKTTSIGKMANLYKKAGKKVLLAAGDTFRAAAIDQLVVWSRRADVDIIKQSEGSDPSAVLFDACNAANARGVDVLICDTAGRLHNKKNLMDELAKMSRVVDNRMPGVSRQTLLVLDATTGQNAVNQAKAFSEIAPVNGIILTKLDGSSKGGIIVSIASELNIPVKLVGVGEGMEDLQPFVPEDFVKALFED
ncbi:MAG: signal recognition particle-docking protein FtsY [Clostridia bacterium]|nr:signal recognition particle-docking protein FtsY [Clostridia bacterium]MBR3838660.1 signal recognition particle-docking protein FtsY [Clostridia bacterium]